MKYKNYYEILDVNRKSSIQDIKLAYRKLAKKYHPDTNKTTEAENIFKDVNEVNLDEKLNGIMYNVADSKKSLDIFTKSFTTLSGSGISIEEEQEYLSYVEGAEKAYYDKETDL